MEYETGNAGPLEERDLDAAVKAVNALHSRRSFREGSKRSDQYQQPIAANTDCQHLRNRILTAAGIDQGEIKRCIEREASEMRAVQEREKRALIDQSSLIAEQHNKLALQRPEILSHLRTFAGANSLITLDVADKIVRFPDVPYESSDGDFTTSCEQYARQRMHNSVKAFANTFSHYQSELFCVDPLDDSLFKADFYFHWTSNADVELNALTFVQPNGSYSLSLGWYPFVSSNRCVTLSSNFKYVLPFPPAPVPPNFDRHQISEGYIINNFANTNSQLSDSISHCIDVGPFDLSKNEYGHINDEFTFFNNSRFFLPAGKTIIFVVEVEGIFAAKGCTYSQRELDFSNGDFEINVPFVFLGVFPI